MDINNNTLINSINRLKEEIKDNSEIHLETKNLKSKKNTNNNSCLLQNSSKNLNNISLNQENKTLKSLKNNFLTQYKEEKRNDLFSNSVSINSDILVKSNKSEEYKEENNLHNNSNNVDSYISEENFNKDIKIDKTSKKITKIRKRIKYISKKGNKINSESTNILNIKLKKNKTENENLIIKNCLSSTIGDDNITSLYGKKINVMEVHNSYNPNGQMKYNVNNINTINNKNNIKKCLFCDKISNNVEYNSFFSCGHFFCKKCGKIFYEEIIEMMIKNKKFKCLQCPVINCPKEISLPLLKLIISENFYNELAFNIDKSKNKDNNVDNNIINNKKCKKEINIVKTEFLEKNENNKERFYKNYEKYLQKSIIDLNSYKKYTYFIQESYKRCPFCREYTLYGKIEGNFDKCLKCMQKYCKYCHKEFSNSHFDLTNTNHCKVFYRTYKDFIQQKFYYKFGCNLLYVIGGYLFTLTFFILQIKITIKSRNIFLKIIKIILYSILFLIFLPICIIMLPYFPMIISL